jgi:hypothetical protein
MRKFRVELLEERVAPASLFWDGPSDQMATDPSAAGVTSHSNGLESVKESMATSGSVVRGFQGSVLAHLGGTRSDRLHQTRPPLAPQEVTELLDDIDRRFNQPLPKNPLDLLAENDRTYNQPLVGNVPAPANGDSRDNQSIGQPPQRRNSVVDRG